MTSIRFDLKSQLTLLKKQLESFLSDHPLAQAMVTGRQGRFVFLALTVMLIWFVGYAHMYRPAAEELKLLKKKMDKVNQKISEMKAQMPDVAREQKTLEKKDQEIESLRDRLRKLESELPARNELAPLLEQLTTSGSGEALKILSIKPVEEKEQKKRSSEKGKKAAEETQFYPEEKFELAIATGFWEFIRYLARLEKVSPYFSFSMVDIQLDEKKRKESEPRMHLQIGALLRERFQRGSKGESVFRKDIPKLGFKGTQQDPFFLAQKELKTQAPPEKYQVSGVIWKGGKKIAIINNQVVREGDKLDHSQVVSIDSSKIIIEQAGRQYEILVV
ncbi:MAG: type 4a pilus biogenesis protein PilO [Candidatus Omnitrophica bacterium]|nr:type 4a pilus biogenesis protein PilO [Candidatus Omnitrophota bacterium]